jgi:hypothetical protein
MGGGGKTQAWIGVIAGLTIEPLLTDWLFEQAGLIPDDKDANMRDLLMVVLFLIIGVGLLIGALSAKRGNSKFMFLLEPNPVVAVDIVYGLIPLGIGCILVAISGMIDDIQITRWLIGIGLGGGVVIGLILIAWKPHWLKPDWLHWLEEHYDEPTREFMFAQARKAGKAWNKRVATQEDLEAWAEEIAYQYRSVRSYR